MLNTSISQMAVNFHIFYMEKFAFFDYHRFVRKQAVKIIQNNKHKVRYDYIPC